MLIKTQVPIGKNTRRFPRRKWMSPGIRPIHDRPIPDQSRSPITAMTAPKTTNNLPSSDMRGVPNALLLTRAIAMQR
jgi:hypothetical protein